METVGHFRYLPNNDNLFIYTYPTADNNGYTQDIVSKDRSSKHTFRNGYNVTEPDETSRRSHRQSSESEKQRKANRKAVVVGEELPLFSSENSGNEVPNGRSRSDSDCSNYLSPGWSNERSEKRSTSVNDSSSYGLNSERENGRRDSSLTESDDDSSSESQASSEGNEHLDLNNDVVEITRSGSKGSPMYISFSGAGFLGVYHLGVASALVKYGHKFLSKVQKYMGASAGSLVAAYLAIYGEDLMALKECAEFCIKLAETVRSKRMGVLDPGVSLMEPMEEFLEKMVPEDGHLKANGKLCISVTNRKTKKNELITHFETRAHLIKYLMGSSYIPKVTGSSKRPIEVDGKAYIDGGFTDNLPRLGDGRTIRVSPFDGRQDICPHDKNSRGFYRHKNNRTIRANLPNVVRQMHSFFPPNQKGLERYFDRGVRDAIGFLQKENMYEEPEDNGNAADPFPLRTPGSVSSMGVTRISVNSDNDVKLENSATSSLSSMTDTSVLNADNDSEYEDVYL